MDRVIIIIEKITYYETSCTSLHQFVEFSSLENLFIYEMRL